MCSMQGEVPTLFSSLFDKEGMRLIMQRRIKMVARMKERFPILARQPRPEVQTSKQQCQVCRDFVLFHWFGSIDSED